LISPLDELHRRYEVFELPNGKAEARLDYADHFGAPRGTPNGSALVFGFAAAKQAVTPGVYRFQVETLEDIPELHGVTTFFVYEEHMKR